MTLYVHMQANVPVLLRLPAVSGLSPAHAGISSDRSRRMADTEPPKPEPMTM